MQREGKGSWWDQRRLAGRACLSRDGGIKNTSVRVGVGEGRRRLGRAQCQGWSKWQDPYPSPGAALWSQIQTSGMCGLQSGWDVQSQHAGLGGDSTRLYNPVLVWGDGKSWCQIPGTQSWHSRGGRGQCQAPKCTGPVIVHRGWCWTMNLPNTIHLACRVERLNTTALMESTLFNYQDFENIREHIKIYQ